MEKTDNKTAADVSNQIDPVAGKSVAEVFGEIVWLMTQDASAQDLKIKDLEHLVMPGILLRQFHIQYAQDPRSIAAQGQSAATNSAKPSLIPVSVEIFAMCSEAVASALAGNPKIRLTMQDWRSGTLKVSVFSTNTSRIGRL